MDDEKIAMEPAVSMRSHEISLPGVGDKAEDMHVDTKPSPTAAMSNADKILDINIDEKTNKPATATTEDGVTESTNTEPEHEYVAGLKLFLVISAITLVIFLMMLDMSIIVTVSLAVAKNSRQAYILIKIQAIPRITSDFQSLSDVGWYGDVFLLARYDYSTLHDFLHGN